MTEGMQIDQEYEVVRIDGDHDPLRAHPQNPNIGDDDTVEESVDENGWYGAITAQKSTGYILAGHTRYRVAKRKKAREIPVIWKNVDDETALKIMLADNQTARRAVMDEERLTKVLESLDTLSGTGFDSVLHPLEREIEDEKPEAPDVPPDPGDPLDEPDEPESNIPDPDDIPDDKYDPQYGVIIMCTTRVRQEYAYEWLKRNANKEWDIRVVAT